MILIGIIGLLLGAKADFVTAHAGHDPNVIAAGNMYSVLTYNSSTKKIYKIYSDSDAIASRTADTISVNTNISFDTSSFNVTSGTLSVTVLPSPGTTSKLAHTTDYLNFHQAFTVTFQASLDFHGSACIVFTLNWVIANASFTNPSSSDVDPITNVDSTEVCFSR